MTTPPTALELAQRVLEHAESSARIEAATGVTLARAVIALSEPTRHDMNTCMDCGRPLVPCTCHEGCPGGMCPVRDCTSGEITRLTAERDELRREREVVRGEVKRLAGLLREHTEGGVCSWQRRFENAIDKSKEGHWQAVAIGAQDEHSTLTARCAALKAGLVRACEIAAAMMINPNVGPVADEIAALKRIAEEG